VVAAVKAALFGANKVAGAAAVKPSKASNTAL
jgi:hypothetical protein